MGAWEKEAKEDDGYFEQKPVTADPSTTEDFILAMLFTSSAEAFSILSVSGHSGPSSSHTNQSQEQSRNAVSYSLPQGVPRRIVKRYSLENNDPPPQFPAEPSPASDETNRSGVPQPQRP
jgi:hypothetical protein